MFPASLMNSCSKFPVIFYTWTILLYFDNKKVPVGLYCYRPTRSIFTFGQFLDWLAILPFNRIFCFPL